MIKRFSPIVSSSLAIIRGTRLTAFLLLLGSLWVAGACSDSSGPAAQSAYKIDVRFFGRALTASEQTLFNNAAARIQQIVVGAVPPSNLTGIDPAKDCGATGVAPLAETENGLLIYASIDSIDGPAKILAQSGPCFTRSQTDFRTSIGVMAFDSADFRGLINSGNAQQVITHEMLHVLGFGGFWDSSGLNLLVSNGTTNVAYIGAGGIAGCRAVGGNLICASSVPVEGTQGGPGTLYSHWRETTFGNELMTGFINSGSNPLSAMSVRSLEDLGYTVDASAADAYKIPGTPFRADAAAEPSPTPGVWERPLPFRPKAPPAEGGSR